jgi:hypothetical protein
MTSEVAFTPLPHRRLRTGQAVERRANGVDHLLVSGAAAQVPGQRFTDLVVIEVYDCTTSSPF